MKSRNNRFAVGRPRIAASLLALVALILSSFEVAFAQQPLDTLRVGHAELQRASIQPGTVVMDSFMIEGDVRTPISTTIRTIRRGQTGRTPTWEIETLHESADGETTHSMVVVRRQDLALVHYKVKAEADSASISAYEGYLTGWVVLPGQPVELIERQFSAPVLAVEGQIPWLFPSLRLREGFSATIEYFSQWGGRKTHRDVRVTGSETAALGEREVDCWLVDAGTYGPPGYRGTLWIEKRTRQIVQSALRGSGEGGTEYWGFVRAE